MKPITISPLSFLLGAITVVGLAVVLGSQEITRRTAVEIPATAFGDTPINVVGIPDPREIIVIEEGTPYLVPAAKLFVVTALGSLPTLNGLFGTILFVDGAPALQFDHNRSASADGMQMQHVPPYLVVPADSVITLASDFEGRAWGYLIDE